MQIKPLCIVLVSGGMDSLVTAAAIAHLKNKRAQEGQVYFVVRKK